MRILYVHLHIYVAICSTCTVVHMWPYVYVVYVYADAHICVLYVLHCMSVCVSVLGSVNVWMDKLQFA